MSEKKGQHILFGDASKPEVLEHAHIEQGPDMVVAISDAAASRSVASLARHLNPTLHIIVRTRYILEVEPLYKLGVNEVIPEEFETSIEILSRVLRNYMVPNAEIERCITEVRSDGYDMFRSMSRRHSHAVGISGYLSGAEISTYRVKKGSQLEGKGLSEDIIRSMSGATVLVIKRGDEVVPNPDPVWELQENDLVLLLGVPQQLSAACGPVRFPIRKKLKPIILGKAVVHAKALQFPRRYGLRQAISITVQFRSIRFFRFAAMSTRGWFIQSNPLNKLDTNCV